MSSRSAVWAHFTKSKDNLVNCNICKHVIKTKGNTSNLHAHLKSKHPNKWREVNEKRLLDLKSGDDTDDIGNSENETNDTVHSLSVEGADEQFFLTPECVLVENEEGSERTPHQPIITSFTTSAKRSNKLDQSVAYFIAVDMQPYSIVEQEGFKHLIKTLQPSYTLPGRKKITESIIPKIYNETKEILLNVVQDIEYISLTTDAWTSVASKSFISLTAHFIKNWQLMSVVLNCREMSEDHTAENLATVLSELLKEWSISCENIVAFATDSGANIVKAVKLLNQKRVSCFGHTINCAIDKILKMDEIRDEIEKIKKIQNAFAHSWQMQRELADVQKKYNIPIKKIPSFSKTRWWSLVNLIEVVVNQNLSLTTLFQTHSRGKYKHLTLSVIEIDKMKALVETLRPIQKMTELMGAEKHVTASAIFPLYRQIKSELYLNTDNDETQLEVAVNGIKRHIVVKILDYLEDRYNRPEENLVQKCMLVDPRFKLFDLEEREVAALKLQLLNELEDINIDKYTPPKIKKTGGLGAIFSNVRATCSGTRGHENELERYLAFPLLCPSEDPLLWWKQNTETFPRLSCLARKYLCVPGTSVPSERVFSKGGSVVTDNRTCLTGEHSEQLIFLSCNREYVKK